MSRRPTVNAQQRRELQAARRIFRLACGVELVLINIGYKATVADAIKAARMSRRQFYEHFASMDDAIAWMHEAVPRMVRMYRIDRPSIDEDGGNLIGCAGAYPLVLADFPHAEPLLLVRGQVAASDLEPYRFTSEALHAQRNSWFGQLGTPRTCESMHPRFLLAYARAMGLDAVAESEAAQ